MCFVLMSLSLSRSEGPAQVFLIVLVWMLSAFAKMTQESRKIILSYDNMCQLNNLKVARKPLPLPGNFSNMWLDVKKIIDTLHIHNHKDERCRELYSPDNVIKENSQMNTMCCEQTFAWLSRYHDNRLPPLIYTYFVLISSHYCVIVSVRMQIENESHYSTFAQLAKVVFAILSI